MNYVHVIIGLPGSGKTTFMNTFSSNYYKLDDFDDFNRIKVLNESNVVVLTSNGLCDEKVRIKFIRYVYDLFPLTVIYWYFFENKPDKCVYNTKKRKNFKKSKIYQQSEKYSIPYDVVPITIYTKHN